MGKLVSWRGTASSYSERSRDPEFSDEAALILKDICRERERNPKAAQVAAFRLATLLTSPGAAQPRLARGGLAPWQKRKIERYIREHLQHPVRVDELADQVRLSPSHFFRAFRQTFGQTPQSRITRLRLEFAQHLMLATEEPLTHIALACGFADQSHLCKVFRRLTRETPGAWRLRNLNDAQAAE